MSSPVACLRADQVACLQCSLVHPHHKQTHNPGAARNTGVHLQRGSVQGERLHQQGKKALCLWMGDAWIQCAGTVDAAVVSQALTS